MLISLGAVVEGVGLLLLIPFLSAVTRSGQGTSFIQTIAGRMFHLVSAETRAEKIALLIGIFVGLVIAKAVVVAVRDVTVLQLELDYIRAIRSRLTRRLAAADWSVISHLRHSRVTHLLVAEIARLSTATVLVFRDLVTVIMLASQVAIAVYLSPTLAMFAVSAVAIGAVTLLPLLTRARKFGELLARANLSIVTDTNHFLGALKLAVGQNLQGSFVREFDGVLDAARAQQVDYFRRQTVMRLTVTTVASLAGAGAVVIGISFLDLSASVLIALLVIFSRMNGPAIQLYVDSQNLVQALPAYEMIRALEHELADGSVSDRTSVEMPPLPSGAVEFRNVTYLHVGDAVPRERAGGVRSLDLVIEPGSIVGVSGSSGAGKTTFADLLVGLYRPQKGTVLVGGVELHQGELPRWRNEVSYVTQDPFLFHETIRRNMLWANPDSSEEALWHALENAGIANFVRRASRGLDTIVGERGSLLSGGERQRISLARALLRKPRLLLLDEATNAIDVESERTILEGLISAPNRPTIVIIAHRRETLLLCDRLILLDRGAVVADGEPASVLANNDIPETGSASQPMRSAIA